MKKTHASYILVLTLLSYPQSLHFKWTELDSPTNKSIMLLQATSPENLLVANSEGEIFRYKNDVWEDLKIVSDLKLNPHVFFVNDSLLLSAATDQKWNTHFFIRVKNNWEKYNYVHENPITKIFEASGNIFAIGAWGSFLILEKGEWKAFDSPFTNHVNNAAVDKKGDIWLVVLSESIYKFHENTFTEYPFEDEEVKNIYGIHITNSNSVEVVGDNQAVYKLYGDRFVKMEKSESTFRNPRSYDKFGFVQINVAEPDKAKFEIEIPNDFNMINHIFSSDSTVYVANSTGNVYIGRPSEMPQFINLAGVYKLRGSPSSSTVGAAYADINSDGYIDLFVFNGDQHDYSNFHLNNPNAPFTDAADAFKLSLNGVINTFALTDFNSDKMIDLIVSTQDSTFNYIQVYENTGTNTFNKHSSISLTEKFQSNYRRNITSIDYDSDGDLDLSVSEYYGRHKAANGGSFVINNSLFGGITEIDTSLWDVTSGWNVQTVFADFNSDEKNEIYIANEWAKNKLLFQSGEKWKDEAEIRIDSLEREESNGAAAFDFDNDGDLDIITVSDTLFITLFENDGNGFFKDITKQTCLNRVVSPFTKFVSQKNICLADFNNDGFTDIFITLKDPDTDCNYLMINQSGKFFEDYGKEYGISEPSINGVVAGDVDNDGDIDLFGFSESSNFLWINTLDNNNYIKIKLEGTYSNSLGISAKIWLYELQKDREKLCGYKQIGTDIYGRNQFNDLTAHFGVSATGTYKAVVKFYGGRVRERTGLLPGSTVMISEVGAIEKFIYSTPAALYLFFSKSEVQYNLLVFIATIILIYLGVTIGIKRFKWSSKNAIVLASINLFLFWIIYIATSYSQIQFIKYFVPLIVLGMSLLFTNVGFYWSSLIGQKKSASIASDELFTLLRNFSHGEWATRNLNSLILFLKNWNENHTEDYETQLIKRIETYHQITSINLQRIIELAGLIEPHSENLNSLSKLISSINNSLKNFLTHDSKETASFIALRLEQLKMNLSDFKKSLYSQYSCDPHLIISEIIENNLKMLDEKGIHVRVGKTFEAEQKVLIKSFELADIIDNLINNAVRSFEEQTNKKISIIISRVVPKVIIEVIDNGKAIPKTEHQKIFKDGYSKTGSSGSGLFLSKKLLAKYGGTIYLNYSSERLGTSFKIELREGYN